MWPWGFCVSPFQTGASRRTTQRHYVSRRAGHADLGPAWRDSRSSSPPGREWSDLTSTEASGLIFAVVRCGAQRLLLFWLDARLVAEQDMRRGVTLALDLSAARGVEGENHQAIGRKSSEPEFLHRHGNI